MHLKDERNLSPFRNKLIPDAYKIDVIGKARDDLKKLDLKVTLLRKQRRQDQKQLRKKKILDKLLASKNGRSPLVAEAIQRLTVTIHH